MPLDSDWHLFLFLFKFCLPCSLLSSLSLSYFLTTIKSLLPPPPPHPPRPFCPLALIAFKVHNIHAVLHLGDSSSRRWTPHGWMHDLSLTLKPLPFDSHCMSSLLCGMIPLAHRIMVHVSQLVSLPKTMVLSHAQYIYMHLHTSISFLAVH